MKRLLDKKDPQFDHHAVRSICTILGRTCPSQADMAQMLQQPGAKASAITTTPTYARGTNSNESKPKRTKIESNGDSTESRTLPSGFVVPPFITMQDPNSFSVASTTMTPGFVSAGSLCHPGLGPQNNTPYPTGYTAYPPPASNGADHANTNQRLPAYTAPYDSGRKSLHPISTNHATRSGPTRTLSNSGSLKRDREASTPYAFLSSSPSKAAETDGAGSTTNQAVVPPVTADASAAHAAGRPKAPTRKTLGVRRGTTTGWTPHPQGAVHKQSPAGRQVKRSRAR